MAYLYRHIRLDKKEPFYIGIGNADNGRYHRAYTIASRNKAWHSIINRTKYEVEILIDNISWEEANNKEIEFIQLYKRKCDGGSLVNMTLGGQGTIGVIPSMETRLKQRIKRLGMTSPIKGTKRPQHVIDAVIKSRIGIPSWNKGMKMSQEHKEKIRLSKIGKPSNKKGVKVSNNETIRLKEIGFKKGNKSWNFGRKMTKKEIEHSRLLAGKNKKCVIKMSMDYSFLKEYESATIAAIDVHGTKSSISKAALGQINHYLGYKWKYKLP